MKKKLLLVLCLGMTISLATRAQTYRLDWNASFSPAYVAGTTDRTATNVGTSGVDVRAQFVNSAAASTWQNTTPAVGQPGGISWTAPAPTGTGSMVLWVNWANTQQRITTTISFSTPVANPTFTAGDIDKASASVGPNDDYLDRITVTGTTPGGSTLNAVASKFNAGSNIIVVSGNSAWANPTVNQGGNASTDAQTGTAQDGTVAFTVQGTVSSITIVWDNFNNAVTTVNPSGQAVNFSDISFTKTVPVSGTVYNDANGDQIKNAAENGIRPVTLYANIIDVATSQVIGVATVNADGTYSAPNIASNTNINIVISTTPGTLGGAAPAAANISGYANTTPTTITGATGTTGLTNQNFGFDQLPTPGTSTVPGQVNPGGTNTVVVPASYFSASDPDGTIASIRITSFPTNATSITIGSTTYTSATFPVGGVTVPTNAAGQPTSTIRVDPIDGIVNVVIDYRATDNAGKESTSTGSVTVQFLSTLAVKIVSFSGNASNGRVSLQWTVNDEAEVRSYMIERSTDAANFIKVGEQNARNTSGDQLYQYNDAAATGVMYYRLKITGTDGRVTYSSVVKISTNARVNEITNVVNPFNDRITFQYTVAASQAVTFNLVDVNGKVQKTIRQNVTAGTNSIVIAGLETLAKGSYYLRVVSADNKVQTLSLIKN